MGRTLPLNVYYLLYENERSNCDNPSLDLNVFDENDSELCKLLDEDNTDNMENIIDINNVTDTDSSDEMPKKKGRKKVVA